MTARNMQSLLLRESDDSSSDSDNEGLLEVSAGTTTTAASTVAAISRRHKTDRHAPSQTKTRSGISARIKSLYVPTLTEKSPSSIGPQTPKAQNLSSPPTGRFSMTTVPQQKPPGEPLHFPTESKLHPQYRPSAKNARTITTASGVAAKESDPLAPMRSNKKIDKEQVKTGQKHQHQQKLQASVNRLDGEMRKDLPTVAANATSDVVQRSKETPMTKAEFLGHEQGVEPKKDIFRVFVQLLLKYLEQKDTSLCMRARAVIQECIDKNSWSSQEGYERVRTLMHTRLRQTVGEAYWKRTEWYLKRAIDGKNPERQQAKRQLLRSSKEQDRNRLAEEKQNAEQQRQKGRKLENPKAEDKLSQQHEDQLAKLRQEIEEHTAILESVAGQNLSKRAQLAALRSMAATATAKKKKRRNRRRRKPAKPKPAPKSQAGQKSPEQNEDQLAKHRREFEECMALLETAAGKRKKVDAEAEEKPARHHDDQLARQNQKTEFRKEILELAASQKPSKQAHETALRNMAIAEAKKKKPWNSRQRKPAKPTPSPPPGDFCELMQMVDHATSYDWTTAATLFGTDQKFEVNLNEEQNILLYGREAKPQGPGLLAARISASAGAFPASVLPPALRGWSKRNVLSARAAWARIRLREQDEESIMGSSPLVGGMSLPGNTMLPVMKSGNAPPASQQPSATPTALWINDEKAEEDQTLCLLSEATEIYIKTVLEKAIQSARRRENLDGIRLWHRQHSTVQKPPLSIRLGCDVIRQTAQVAGNAAKIVQRMEEALERQDGVPASGARFGQ